MPLPPTFPGPVKLTTPERLHHARFARNGLIPHAQYETGLASRANFVGACCNKELFRAGTALNAIPNGTTSRVRWRFAGHTGPVMRQLRATLYLARQNTGDPVFSPKVTVYITNANESVTYGSASLLFGAAPLGGVDVPSEFGQGTIIITGVPANTTIYGRIEETDQARLIAATVYEQSAIIQTGSGYVRPAAVAAQSPILDNRRQDLLELATNLWTDGAAPLFSWSVDDQASPITNATNTAKNIADNAATGAAGPTWTLDTRYCGTRARSMTVPCMLSVRTKMSTTTATGQIRLRGVSGGLISTTNLSGTTAERWVNATLNLPAALDDYYVEFLVSSGSGTLSVYAASLFQLA